MPALFFVAFSGLGGHSGTMRCPTALLRAPAVARFAPALSRYFSTKDNSYKIIAATEVPQATESLRASGWSVVGAQLSKTYEFKGFQAAWVSAPGL
jgi:hypothetical protein